MFVFAPVRMAKLHCASMPVQAADVIFTYILVVLRNVCATTHSMRQRITDMVLTEAAYEMVRQFGVSE